MAAGQSGDVDSLLKDIATDISGIEVIEALGKELGFTVAECQNFIETNYRHNEITNYGTVCMLRKWSRRVSPSSLRSDLRGALMRARLLRIAETHLPSVGLYHTAEYARDVVSSKNADSVTTAHINGLVRLVPPGKYTDLCIMLGFEYSEAQQILAKFGQDYGQALSDILHSWVDAKVRSSDDLRKALVGAELGDVFAEVNESVRLTETNEAVAQPTTTGRKRAGKGASSGTSIEQQGSTITISGNITNLSLSGQEANVRSSREVSQAATRPKTASKTKGAVTERDEEGKETGLSNNLRTQQQRMIFAVASCIASFVYFLYIWMS